MFTSVFRGLRKLSSCSWKIIPSIYSMTERALSLRRKNVAAIEYQEATNWRLLPCTLVLLLSTFFDAKIYVSLQLRVQNRRRKWHFPLNFRNAINWAGAFSKAFSSSEALISVLSKNAHLCDNIYNSFQSKTLYIVLICKWSRLDTNLWIWNLCICQKTCQKNANIW